MSDIINSDYKINEYNLTVKEPHIDFIGHVNNATYLEIFEEARWELITHGGYGIDVIRKNQSGPVILEVTIKFLKEISLREDIVVKTQLQNYQGKVGELQQWMENSKGEVCATAHFKFGLFDFKTRKLILPNPEWSKAIGM